MQKELNDALNSGIIHERAHTFAANVKRNSSLIEKWGGLTRLPSILSGKNVLITGAGPSLNGAMSMCRKASVSSDCVIIASDMSLKPLLKNGIIPRFVITCETTSRGFFSGCITSQIILLAFSCASPSNLRQWGGSYMFYNWMMKGEPWETIWKIAGEELGYVATGGTVVTQALAAVLGCGAASVTFAGNDLAFCRSCYARGTVVDEERASFYSRFSTVEGMDFSSVRKASHYRISRRGKLFATSTQFLAAKEWSEDLCTRTDIPVLDASFPGLSEKYVRHI